MVQGFKIILLTVLTFSCSQLDRDNLKGYIEYKTESQNYIRWSREQPITWDLFKGDCEDSEIYGEYIGLYFFYEFEDSLKYNVTIYLDKTKSCVKPKDKWINSKNYELIPQLLKIKFDFYETYARELRKHLSENDYVIADEEKIRYLANDYFERATADWKKIEGDTDAITEYDVKDLRESVDEKLETLKQYDTSLNSISK